MTRPSKSHRSHRPQFTPLGKAFAHSLYRYYHASTQAQRDQAVDQLMDAFRAEKTLTQPSVIASAAKQSGRRITQALAPQKDRTKKF